jgi:hypothetical protein
MQMKNALAYRTTPIKLKESKFYCIGVTNYWDPRPITLIYLLVDLQCGRKIFKSQNFGKSSLKCQNAQVKAQFERPKYHHQATFETFFKNCFGL